MLHAQPNGAEQPVAETEETAKVRSILVDGRRFNTFNAADVITPPDITMVICLRAHEGNHWVMERIRLIRSYYNPMPRVLVLDFGSQEPFASELSTICALNGLDYYHEPDTDTYSPAAAHNRGFEKCETDLVFFCDADCFGPADMFGRMAGIATALKMKSFIDTPLILPVYHLNQTDTQAFFEIGDSTARSNFLDAMGFYSSLAEFRKEENFFIAPYSNIFLINRRMFSLTGGYDERFRGHGSEDFEYLTRLGLYIKNAPLPAKLMKDHLGPLRDEFFGARQYSGFRRFLEALSKPAENFGLRVFHLYHERSKREDWGSQNDWKRERMSEAFGVYVDAEHNLLQVDFLAREKTVACLCKHVDQWGYYTPLRAAGYRLRPVFDDEPETIASITDGLVSGELTALAIFNPYMKSHAQFKQLVLLARDLGREVIIIERGALPGTIYYDEEVAYASPSFTEERFRQEQFSDDEIAGARSYIEELRAGDDTLEQMDDYATTRRKLSGLAALTKPICFIPLQLHDDMAVTMFIKGGQQYPEFSASLSDTISANPDIIFVVKPHPLSKLDLLAQKPNLILAAREDNIHCLLDLASFVVCYNSGVGLLSLLHQTPTATIGNAFYNMAGAGYHASSAQDAVEAFKARTLARPSAELVERIAAWFIFRRYSRFVATDNLAEFKERKAHGYKDILVTHFRWNGIEIPLDRQRSVVQFSHRSYAWSQLGAASAPRQNSASKHYEWGITNYRRGNFAEAAKDFTEAFEHQPSRPNLLRYAAEAYWRDGNKRMAKIIQSDAVKRLPHNKRARLRLLTMKFPPLRFIIGAQKMEIPIK
ncbi:glycosyltransferase [Sinorhizobium meliloti]|nr:glycosyltransferase [Sinorhizobium meliloti]MDX0378617.1 glycosyltransferase [Sinorhizobium meliloti]